MRRPLHKPRWFTPKYRLFALPIHLTVNVKHSDVNPMDEIRYKSTHAYRIWVLQPTRICKWNIALYHIQSYSHNTQSFSKGISQKYSCSKIRNSGFIASKHFRLDTSRNYNKSTQESKCLKSSTFYALNFNKNILNAEQSIFALLYFAFKYNIVWFQNVL